MAKSGDKVRVVCENENIEGALLPNEESDTVVIKLDSGYNRGIDKKHIKRIDFIEQAKPAQQSRFSVESIAAKELSEKKKFPVISVLHTGGTIASKVDYSSGAVSAAFGPEDMLNMVPEIGQIANVRSSLVMNIMSEDMRFSNYAVLAEAVKKEISAGAKGIIIGHGTDTLGYSAAALSFLLGVLPVPVILVGSQRSSDRGSSDARMNLLSAARFIISTDFAGVAVCMHESSADEWCSILPGTRVRKLHTSRRDAFKAVNSSPIARVNVIDGSVKFLIEEYPKRSDTKSINPKTKMADKIALIKTFPNMHADIFEFLAKSNYNGIVIEGTGLGHMPMNAENLPIFNAVRKHISGGGVVAMTSQCINGRVHSSVYTNLRKLSEIGVVFCEDMLPETAFIKLAWLLGNHPADEAKKLLLKNLAGEISERSEYQEF